MYGRSFEGRTRILRGPGRLCLSAFCTVTCNKVEWRSVLVETIVDHLVENFPAVMEPEGPVPRSQTSAAGLCSKPVESSAHSSTLS